MFGIDHNDAIELEYQIRRLYKCDRGGVSGMVDADCFQRNPVLAAQLAVAYVYAKGLEKEPYAHEGFLYKYEVVFDHPDEYDITAEVKNYIAELRKIIDYYAKE